MTAPFLSGRELSARFHAEVVRPILRDALGGEPYSAALIGYGSDVQGYDDRRSTDHAWGPRMTVFLGRDAFDRLFRDLDEVLDRRLPARFCGYAVRFAVPDGAPARHHVDLAEPTAFFTEHFGADPLGALSSATWLSVPTQVLRELTGGSVFHDGLDVLERSRRALAWYPDDVWRYVLACQWMRLSQEEPFVGRCGEVGDDLGSAVVAARQVRDIMRLCLLIDRVYPPYSKWLGTAFAATACADRLRPHLSAVLAAGRWTDRERSLSHAYEMVAELHNDRGLTDRVDPRVRQFHDRPFQVLDAHRFADALMASVADPWLRALPRVGAIDQYVDSTDLLDRTAAPSRRAYLTGPGAAASAGGPRRP